MSDNLKKKKLDGKRISQQPWEQAYQRRKRSKTAKEFEPQPDTYDPNKYKRWHVQHLYTDWSDPESVARHRKRKLELAVEALEHRGLINSRNGKQCIAFCEEWKVKGKPIFKMVLELFAFKPKTQAMIQRVMNGVDGVCKISEAVTKAS